MSEILATLQLLMMETASIDKLFHNTNANSALLALREGVFRLPLAETNASESVRGGKYRHLPGLFYLSTARTLNSGYISDRSSGLGVINNPVTFVIDTKRLRAKNRGIKIVSFEYWNLDSNGRSLGSGREAEERIYSNNRRLNIKGCVSVLICIEDSKYRNHWMAREVWSYCLKNRIPVKLFTYGNLSGFRLQKEKPEDRDKAIALLKAAKRDHSYGTRNKGIAPYQSKTAAKFWNKDIDPNKRSYNDIEALWFLVNKNDYRDVPEKIKSRLLWNGEGLFKRLEGTLHNLRADSGAGGEDTDKIGYLVKQMKAKSLRDFFAKLDAKWERLQKRE